MKKWILAASLCAIVTGALIGLHRSTHRANATGFDIGTRTGTPAPPRTGTPQATRTPAAPAPVPRPTPPPSVAALGPGIMTATCIGSLSTRVVFLWTPSHAGMQYLDLSIYNNGFVPDTFIGVGGFAPLSYGYIWEGLLPGTTHFARVNTYTSVGWRSSPTLAFYTPVCDARASEVAPAPDMVELHDAIADAIGGSTIDTAVAITDLRTGESIAVEGDAPRLPGCTINLFGLMRVVVDLQAGKYPEREAGDLIGQTINRSDPVTARRLMRDWIGDGDLVDGMERVNDFMHALGMTDTEMDHPPAFPEESLETEVSNRTTALDVNRGLAALWGGRVLNPFWRDYLYRK